MALTISYNQDGSVTVKSGDEQVTIVAHAPEPTGAQFGDLSRVHIGSRPAQPAPRPRQPQPARPPGQPTPPIIVGPPPIGPRFFILPPGYDTGVFDRVGWSEDQRLTALRGTPCLMRRRGTAVDLAMACNQFIEVRTLMKSVGETRDERLDLYVWQLPAERIDY